MDFKELAQAVVGAADPGSPDAATQGQGLLEAEVPPPLEPQPL